ncbi:hypothetical protein CJD44_09285 [Streptomyces sp. alain-838]|nr:hypothetical protein CJD44_09285 [Streptomyces sp. alain-838]
MSSVACGTWSKRFRLDSVPTFPSVPRHADPAQSLEQLEGQRWPDPSQMARLITQDVGLLRLLPLVVRILHDTAPAQAAGGWHDDDLLYAVVTRRPQVWEQSPELARESEAAVGTLGDLSRYVRDEVESFLSSLPEEAWRLAQCQKGKSRSSAGEAPPERRRCPT